MLVIASLANEGREAYVVRGAPDGDWREVFNSDSECYGGWHHGNAGGTLQASDGRLTLAVPRAGLVVLEQR